MTANEYATTWRRAAPRPHGPGGRARALGRRMALSALAPTATRGGNFLRALYCHYVFDDQISRFESLIANLRKIGSFVDTETCLDMLEGRRKIDGRYFHLSFDDGFRNFFTNAMPVLVKHQVPAIVFVPSAFISADWRTTKKYCLEIAQYRGVVETMKWEDLSALSRSGFEVGSHTRTHARLSALTSDRELLAAEIHGSKEEIENQLGIECKYLSWPYGTLNDADEASLEMTREAGYRACFGAFRGTIRPHRTGAYRIPRHHFEVQWPWSHVRYFALGKMEATS